jgi:hypothetical protein
MARFADGIIRHHVKHQVLRSVVRELVRLARLEDEGIARLDWRCSILVPDNPAAGNHVIKLPLRAMRVIRTRRLARWNPANLHVKRMPFVRACLETTSGPAAGDFGCGQGGEFRASPQRAVRNEPAQATGKRPAARRVFAPKAAWLRCSSVEDPPGVFPFVTPRHPAFGTKTGPLIVFKQALTLMFLSVYYLDQIGPASFGHSSRTPSLRSKV